MSDDRMIRANEREIFEAIVSQVVDPELARLHRVFLVLGLGLFVAGLLAVGVVGGLGWPGLLAFSSTFLPGVLLARLVYVRRFLRPPGRRRRRLAV
jgi:nitrate reductase NapE component